jgi:hypothetical protein
MKGAKSMTRGRLVACLCLTLFAVALLLPAEAAAQCNSAWVPNTFYGVGAKVSYSSRNYTAQQAHTSQVGWEPPNVPALWVDNGSCSGGGGTSTPTSRPTSSPTPGGTASPTPTGTSTPPPSATATPTNPPATATPTSSGTWRRANLTWFTSYPDPDSDECRYYNGCTWAGYFAFVDGKQTEAWVAAHNIAAVHQRDAQTYKLKNLRLKQGTRQIDVTVYDMCADSDCSGCCTQNADAGGIGFLIDIESYTMQRFGSGSGIVDWQCLNCP